MIRVMNKRTYTGPGHYIGRPSPLGNPYHVGRDRAACIAKYEAWLKDTPPQATLDALFDLIREHRKIGGLTLICWCAPLACHGDVLARLIEKYNKELP